MWTDPRLPDPPYIQYVPLKMDDQFYSMEYILMCFMGDSLGRSRMSIAYLIFHLPAENNL